KPGGEFKADQTGGMPPTGGSTQGVNRDERPRCVHNLGDMKGNPHYRWHADGVPDENYVAQLDEYSGGNYESYGSNDFPNKVRDILLDLFQGHNELLRKRFHSIIDCAPPSFLSTLDDLVQGVWTRSNLYRILGLGIRHDGTRDEVEKALNAFAPSAIENFRKLINGCWYLAIDNALKLPTRYPGVPPTHLLTPTRDRFTLADEVGEEDWFNWVLLDRDIAAAYITGDFRAVVSAVASWNLHTVVQTRELEPLITFRKKYTDWSFRCRHSRGAAYRDTESQTDLVKSLLTSLKVIGEMCGVSIKEVSKSAAAIRWLGNLPVLNNLLAEGLFIVIDSVPAGDVSPTAKAAAKRVIALTTMRLHPIGLRNDPLKLYTSFLGPTDRERG
ncbi:MAG: hypothetical protein ACK5AZ_24545, partial [Bryobacteraceae bacterium]